MIYVGQNWYAQASRNLYFHERLDLVIELLFRSYLNSPLIRWALALFELLKSKSKDHASSANKVDDGYKNL